MINKDALNFLKKRMVCRLCIIFIFLFVVIFFFLVSVYSEAGNNGDNNSENYGMSDEVLSSDPGASDIVSEDYGDADAIDRMYDRMVAITFDDGPNSQTTEKLLDGLRERGVRATFFLIGKSIVGNEELIKRMHDEGHLIGNHTYSHIKLDASNMSAAIKEITDTNELITSITGEEVKYIRPPFGAYTDALLSSVNMTPVLWSVDPDDWATENTSKIVQSVVNNAKNGDIILLHDIYDSSVAAALEIIDQLRAKGFIFVTVDQLLLD